MAPQTEAPRRSRNSSLAQQLLPWLIFLILALGAAAIFVLPRKQQQATKAALIAQNESLGLPHDYPLDRAPLYPGVHVLSCAMTDATSTDGKPMDQWDLKGESDDPPQKLEDFYKDFCSSKKMMQTQMISIPTGSSMDYADEDQILHVEIERPSSAKTTSLKITYYILKDKV